jgi:hypothetical protein
MQTNLLRLVYVSTSTTAIDPQTMQAILEHSSAHNALSGITGVLCGGARHYLQVLEGPELAVMQLYVRVAADARHRDSVLLSVELIAERMFDQWSMGHIEGQMKTADIKAPLLALRRLDGGSEQVAMLLRAFLDRLRSGNKQPQLAVSAR